jgi:AcrR family transcriptional regulator
MSLAARRTQEERSTATRERLLDATIECLIELGYAKTTTSEIVRRAGVSRGAQVHHFPTKAELVQSAIVHLAHRQFAQLKAGLDQLNSRDDQFSGAIDLIWESYSGPLFTAALELIVAARTDESLRPAVKGLEADIARAMREMAGRPSDRSGAEKDVFDLTVCLMQGLAFGRLIDRKPSREKRLLETWKRTVHPLVDHR